MKWREDKHSRRSGAEECWINRSDFSSKECMHTEQQALQCGALEFLKQQGMRSAVFITPKYVPAKYLARSKAFRPTKQQQLIYYTRNKFKQRIEITATGII